MSKMCWKCGKYHDDGDRVCPYCGASFASQDSKYHTDGRTVSDSDDKAYLTSAPPKYKKSHKGALLAVVVCLLFIGVFIMMLGGNGGSGEGSDTPVADKSVVTYDFTSRYPTVGEISPSYTPSAGNEFQIVELTVHNKNYSPGVHTSYYWWNITYNMNGGMYSPHYYTTSLNEGIPDLVAVNGTTTIKLLFEIPTEATTDRTISIAYGMGGFSLVRDRTLS